MVLRQFSFLIESRNIVFEWLEYFPFHIIFGGFFNQNHYKYQKTLILRFELRSFH